jgi:hypothetical protein
MTSAPPSSALGPLCFAAFTSLRFVLKSLVGEKHLFASREHKLRAALRTLQYPVVVFHEPLSPGPVAGRRLGRLCTRGPRCLRRPVSGDAGRGSLGPASTKLKHEPKTSLPYGGLILGSAAPSRVRNGKATPAKPGPPPKLNPLPAAASCAVASAKALLLHGVSRRASCRSCAS